MRISSQDKPFITAELKKLDRQKSSVYTKRGKTDKYKQLERQFKEKYKSAAKKYLNKNMDSLKNTNPGQAFSNLKKMGAEPGDCVDTIPSHCPTMKVKACLTNNLLNTFL